MHIIKVMVKNMTSSKPIATNYLIAKRKESARDLKEITKEMDRPRVAVSVREFLLKQFESEIGCIQECATRLEGMGAGLGQSQAQTLKLIANNLRGNSAFVVRLLKEVESEVTPLALSPQKLSPSRAHCLHPEASAVAAKKNPKPERLWVVRGAE